MEEEDDKLQQDQHSLPPPSPGDSVLGLTGHFFPVSKKARRCNFQWICACLVAHLTPLQQHNIPHRTSQGRSSKPQLTCWLAPGAVGDHCWKKGVISLEGKFIWVQSADLSETIRKMNTFETWRPLSDLVDIKQRMLRLMCWQHNFPDKTHSKKWDVHTYIVLLYLESRSEEFGSHF